MAFHMEALGCDGGPRLAYVSVIVGANHAPAYVMKHMIAQCTVKAMLYGGYCCCLGEIAHACNATCCKVVITA
jgi:hypothetical protein